MISLLPPPTVWQLISHYEHIDHVSKSQSVRGPGRPFSPSPSAASFIARYWRSINDPYPYLAKGVASPIVDLGAGSGGFCLLAQANGHAVTGIEQSARSVAAAVSAGADVRQGDVLHPATITEIPLAQTVTMNHVLEHLMNPVQFLQELHGAMPDGATLIILVPNPECLWRRLFQGVWHGWDPPIHVHHYSSSAINHILRQTGFRIVSIRSKARPDGLTRSLIHGGFLLKSRYLFIRLLLVPFLPLLELFGLGDELICIARRG